MPVFKNEGNGTWYVMARYVNWKGERKQKCKRGFATKREAQEWERKFQLQNSADLDMDFEAFTELYANDVKNRLKENTWLTKEHIIRTKILPYFGKMKISGIGTKEIIAWQNELLAYRDEKRNPYSQTYLKTVHNQLSAIFNHAVRYYDLRSNPAAKAGNMGSEEHKEMLFWTKEEYKRFADEMMDKPVSFYAFEMLYWCGIREGELLALTAADFNFDKETVTINKSYQRLHGEDVITSPKTKKSNRTIKIPKFLCEEMQEYIGMLYGLKKKDRIFTITKSYLHHEMDRGAKAAGVKRIRIHDLRHSHASLLIDMGFNILMISERLGHKSVQTTWNTYAHLYPDKGRQIAYGLQEAKVTGITTNKTAEDQVISLLGEIQKMLPNYSACENDDIILWDRQKKEKSIVDRKTFDQAVSPDTSPEEAFVIMIKDGYYEANEETVFCFSSRSLPAKYL